MHGDAVVCSTNLITTKVVKVEPTVNSAVCVDRSHDSDH